MIVVLLIIPQIGRANIISDTVKIAEANNLPPLLLLGICKKESGFDQKAVGAEGEIGIAQFKWGTFNAFKQEAGMPELKITEAEDQVILLAWGLRNGKELHWATFAEVIRTINIGAWTNNYGFLNQFIRPGI